MSKFDKIAAFIAVVEANSFAKAARQKQVSVPAISRQVAGLESELGVQLLLRTTRKLSLTDIGADYYQSCKKTLAELNTIESEIIGSKKEATGILKITSSRYFAIKYLIPYLAEFRKQNPKLKIKLELAERFPDLAEEKIDVLFGVSIAGPQGLVRKRVTTTRYVLCASPKYFKKYGVPESPTDLIHHIYITHDMRKPDNLLLFRDNEKVCVQPAIWLNDTQAMRECALQGMGIVMLHDYMVADVLKSGELTEILKEYQEPQQAVYLYYQQSKYLQPKIRKFIDFYTAKIKCV